MLRKIDLSEIEITPTLRSSMEVLQIMIKEYNSLFQVNNRAFSFRWFTQNEGIIIFNSLFVKGNFDEVPLEFLSLVRFIQDNGTFAHSSSCPAHPDHLKRSTENMSLHPSVHSFERRYLCLQDCKRKTHRTPRFVPVQRLVHPSLIAESREMWVGHNKPYGWL